MVENGIEYRLKGNSQEFPDFYLHPTSDTTDLLEVKCFTKSPNFDIANFISYCTSILKNPHRLEANYLIFKYSQDNSGIIIEDIWLRKVWEICCPSERTPIKLQIKKGQIYNIRPATWYGNSKYRPFTSRKDFVIALHNVLKQQTSGELIRRDFIDNVAKKFKEQTNNDL